MNFQFKNLISVKAIVVLGICASFSSWAKDSKSPIDNFLKENTKFTMKKDFSKDVIKLLGQKRNPALVEGDFNGDGETDYVALLKSSSKDYMVFFSSDGKTFKNKFKKIPQDNLTYLSTVAEKHVQSGTPKNRPRDLVQLETYYGPTTAYYIEGDQIFKFNGKLTY